jgi:hypothetical protein
MQMIDSTWCETVGVADVNRDAKLDLIACEYWYQAPTWTPRKIRDINFNGTYVDNFSDLPLDVDGDGYVDVIQIAYFERRILWLRNPGRKGGAWTEHDIDRVGPVEFAFLVDLDNDGRANELLPQFTGGAQLGTQWYELDGGKWTKHVVSPQPYGHGIGVGDINRDGRNDIVTTMAHSYGVLWFEQLAEGRWTQRLIDNTWAQAHASALADVNGDGQFDLVSGKRYWARSAASDASEREPLGLYWYEFRRRVPVAPTGPPAAAVPTGTIEWVRHIIDYGSRAGGGLQLRVVDVDGDGDSDVISGGKSGLFLAENLTRSSRAGLPR